MIKPLIGITLDLQSNGDSSGLRAEYRLKRNYSKEVEKAGGVPLILPFEADVAELAKVLDGVVISGGADVDPKFYSQEPHPAIRQLSSERFVFERELLNRLPKECPILGICYGCQAMNVLAGGTLIQHLPDIVETEHEHDVVQSYAIDAGTKLHQILGSHAKGASAHHQSIDRLGQNLKIVARHEDGTVEAIEDPSRDWYIGVQWHPERTQDAPETDTLFKELIEACRRYQANKRICHEVHD